MSGEGIGERREKMILLVGYVNAYWGFFEGEREGANLVWIL